MAPGYIALLLHAHLPFIRHPEYENFLEETWLFEAITETYIPLLRVFERLVQEGVRFRVTLSLSPTLVAMLQDPFLQQRFLAHTGKILQLSESEVARTRNDARFSPLAAMYRRLFSETIELFENRYRRDLVGAFAELENEGAIELITTAATHGYLPVLRVQESSVRAQVLVAGQAHRRAFGKCAQGLWLPECGYYPGLEAPLKDAGLCFFVVDTHGLLNASHRPRYGTFAPIACPNGVAAFGRDAETSKQVWSAEEGYPGDVHYRDFYRDAGYDLPFAEVRPYLLDGHTRVQTGLKYYRITGKGAEKEPYDPGRAWERTQVHAQDFLERCLRIVETQATHMDRPPLIVAPYDAELFGHWWFEGPIWLEHLIRGAAQLRDRIELITPADYLKRHSKLQVATPSASSWGDRGYSAYWLNQENDWIYPHLHQAARRMHEMARAHHQEPEGTLVHRALQQAARSLLLAQASDWAFIMKTGTAVEYAYRRVRDHLARFQYLDRGLRRGGVEEDRLRALEYMDSIFPEIDYRSYA